MVGHNPTLKTLVMIETTIINSETHPTRMELYRSLPRKIEYQTYKTALEYLEAHNMIIFNKDTIIYTGGKNEKLQKLIKNRITI
jgi:hypothetical protein